MSREHVGIPNSCFWNGSVRYLGPETSGGIGPERPIPGVPCLLPRGHSASYWRLERYIEINQTYNWPMTFSNIFNCLLPIVVKDDAKRERYRDKIKSYMDRAEQIKSHVKQIKEGKLSTDWFHIWQESDLSKCFRYHIAFPNFMIKKYLEIPLVRIVVFGQATTC